MGTRLERWGETAGRQGRRRTARDPQKVQACTRAEMGIWVHVCVSVGKESPEPQNPNGTSSDE